MVAAAVRTDRPDGPAALGIAAVVFVMIGEHDRARRTAEQGISLLRRFRTPTNRFYAYQGLGYALIGTDPEAAFDAAHEVLRCPA